MPLNLEPSNSIIKAYLAGRQLKAEREDTAYKRQQDVIERQEKDKVFKEQVRQYDEKLAQDMAQFDAEHKLRQSAYELQNLSFKQGAIDHYLKTGAIPPGFSRGMSRNVGATLNNPQGVAQYQTLNRMNPDTFQDESVEVPSLNTYANQQAEMKRIMDAPETEQKALLEEIKRAGELNLKNEDRTYQEKRDQRQHNFTMLEIAERSKNRVNTLDRPLDYKTQIEYFGNYDVNRTPKTVAGGTKSLNPNQQGELADLDAISDAAREIQRILDPDLAVSANEMRLATKAKNYFANGGTISGLVKRAEDAGVKLKGGEKDKDYATIAAKLANLNQKIALANFGKVIPSGEKDILKQISAGPEHAQTLTGIQAKIQEILKRNDETKLKALNYAKTPNPAAPNTTRKPFDDILKDLNIRIK